MHLLATKHWTELSERDPGTCRMTWTVDALSRYFSGGGREKECVREGFDSPVNVPILIQVLDVGSCYNPLNGIEGLSVTAIDLCPASPSVHRCDFLSTPITQETRIEGESVISLAASSFDCVLFSLLLEYLPVPELRWQCCQKAYQILDREGLLIIITPDSKSAHCNAHEMKSWKNALATLGLRRVRYDKLLHTHCMAFRKTLNGPPTDQSPDGVAAMMYIPQDRQEPEPEQRHPEPRPEDCDIARDFALLATDF